MHIYIEWLVAIGKTEAYKRYTEIYTEAYTEILKRRGALCRPPWLAGKKYLGFREFKKAKISLETISFWQNISIIIFKFSSFLSIKSYQFLKIY